MAKIKGIDISYYQENVDFKKVAQDGIKFAVLRQGYRNTIDSQFLKHVKGCKQNNIDIMVYHFIYTNRATPKQNAESTYQNLKKANLDPATTWIAADLEYDTWIKNGEKCTKEKCTRYTKEYLDTLKALGCKNLFIYTNIDYYENYYDWSQLKYPIWLADLNGEPNYPCVMQQYKKGPVKGINDKEVDLDWLFDETMLNKSANNIKNNKTLSTEQIIRKAASFMINIANDNSHGYSQDNRWGPDYDCSSLIITSYEQAGIPVKTNGATYTGNMKSVFLKCGFKDVTHLVNLNSGAGLQYGDVLLNEIHHTAMYIGNGQQVEASINEYGGAHGGKPGDQTGQEIKIRSYRNYPWNCVLRLTDNASLKTNNSPDAGVKQMQKMLIKLGYSCGADGADGYFGKNTKNALKNFQKDNNLEVDGIYGPKSKSKLTKLYNEAISSSTIKKEEKNNNIKIDYAKSFNKNIAKTYQTTANLRLRAGASTSKDIITTIPRGDKVTCYGYYTNDWYYVQYKTYVGFCSKNYLK